jgi:hypothetical protein
LIIAQTVLAATKSEFLRLMIASNNSAPGEVEYADRRQSRIINFQANGCSQRIALMKSRSNVSGEQMGALPYSIHEHKHRFSAWAAGRAANVNGCRFSVEQAKAILERANLKQLLVGPDQLPGPLKIDLTHLEWRDAVIAAAKSQDLNFTHGVAAKLINIYLKAGLVCSGHATDPRVQALHPPIDGMLLDELYQKNVGGLRVAWSKARATRWSKFTSEQYQAVISSIRTSLGGNVPLWEVEQYWRGYQ